MLGKKILTRNRNGLTPNSIDKRCASVSQTQKVFLEGSLARTERNEREERSASKKAKHASSTARDQTVNDILNTETSDFDDKVIEQSEPVESKKELKAKLHLQKTEELIKKHAEEREGLEKNSQEYRRFAIAYFFVEIYGSPPEEEWPGVCSACESMHTIAGAIVAGRT